MNDDRKKNSFSKSDMDISNPLEENFIRLYPHIINHGSRIEAKHAEILQRIFNHPRLYDKYIHNREKFLILFLRRWLHSPG